jgi:hypothetical protein
LTTEKSVETNLRRAARRRGLGLHKSRLRDPGAIGYDTWRIIDAASGRVIAADLTLEEVAARLGRPIT